MLKPKIRKATKKDLLSIPNLVFELQKSENAFDPDTRVDGKIGKEYTKEILGEIKKNKGILLVAELKGKIVGFISGWTVKESILKNKYFYISDLIITEEYRGEGIGTTLLKEIEKYAKKLKLKTLRLSVQVDNHNPHHLYINSGFQDYNMEMKKEL